MKINNNKFKEILFWAFKKSDTGFTRKELQDKFKLNNERVEVQLSMLMPIKTSDRLIDELYVSGKQNLLQITQKGISVYFELKKPDLRFTINRFK